MSSSKHYLTRFKRTPTAKAWYYQERVVTFGGLIKYATRFLLCDHNYFITWLTGYIRIHIHSKVWKKLIILGRQPRTIPRRHRQPGHAAFILPPSRAKDGQLQGRGRRRRGLLPLTPGRLNAARNHQPDVQDDLCSRESPRQCTVKVIEIIL